MSDDSAAKALAIALGNERDGKLDEALASYDQAIEEGIEDVLIYSNRGMLLEKLQRYEEALESFQKASEVEENFRDRYNAGNMLLMLECHEEAIDQYLASTKLRDDYPECWVNLGIAYHATQQTDKAENALKLATGLNPEFYPALRSLAILYSSIGREGDAIEYYQKAAEVQPQLANAWFEYACAMYKNLGDQIFFEPSGPEGMTMQALDKVIELDPSKQGAWGRKIGVLFRLVDGAEATDQAAASADTSAPRMLPIILQELLSTIENACERFPDDQWFAERMKDAKEFAPK